MFDKRSCSFVIVAIHLKESLFNLMYSDYASTAQTKVCTSCKVDVRLRKICKWTWLIKNRTLNEVNYSTRSGRLKSKSRDTRFCPVIWIVIWMLFLVLFCDSYYYIVWPSCKTLSKNLSFLYKWFLAGKFEYQKIK